MAAQTATSPKKGQEHLHPFQYKPGQSGNPKGRAKNPVARPPRQDRGTAQKQRQARERKQRNAVRADHRARQRSRSTKAMAAIEPAGTPRRFKPTPEEVMAGLLPQVSVEQFSLKSAEMITRARALMEERENEAS